MHRNVLASAFALVFLLGAASDTGRQSGRYTMTPVDEGYLRFDSDTGALSMCRRKAGAWACSPVPDEHSALKSEIERLAGENKELQGAIKRLEELLRLPDEAAPSKRGSQGVFKFRLPTEGDIDTAADYVQRMLRKFKDRMRDLKGDYDPRNL